MSIIFDLLEMVPLLIPEALSNHSAITLCILISQTSVHFQVVECHAAGEHFRLKLHIPYAVSQWIHKVLVRFSSFA